MIERRLARAIVDRMMARRLHDSRDMTASDEIDAALDIAAELYMHLHSVLEAYNVSPFNRPDLPLVMARTPEEARAVQESRLRVAEMIGRGIDLWPIEPPTQKPKLDNSPMLGGDRKQKADNG